MAGQSLGVIENIKSSSQSFVAQHDDAELYAQVMDRTMPISFSCPQCGKNFNADDSFAGKKVRCKQCGTKTTVPSPSSGSQKPGSRPPEPDDLYGLAEPAPMLPPRAPLPRNNISENTPTRKTKGTASKSSTGVKKGAPWAAIAIGVLILRVFLRLNRGNQGHPDNPVIQPQAAASIVATAPSGPPPFPQRGPGTLIRPAVRVFEARASGPSNVATMNMTVWAYLPDGAHDRRSLPCVIDAARGQHHHPRTGTRRRRSCRAFPSTWPRATLCSPTRSTATSRISRN